ncbi:hypothetical protein HBH64_012680 [Parastagonospora nodorum]|nr:hypothetical protein HBI01_010220 [Parastagonospora nodorum]KAH4316514.1 hypothetical protein HBI02_047820 [Parastagonospora nodorum]KAH4531586.1 hypothetical protein HBH87_032970 [Parastagonospora nodorum]KAH4583776.1 hypothetical protein HBH83_160940 [Parastagonospora nodorum]KAH4649178.1 hypothetical protein HBH80_234730 [Parastagonospora nodorum]
MQENALRSAMASTATSIKSGFLNLPAELRNDICQLALTDKIPLFAEVNWPRGRALLSASVPVDIDPTQEFNQLKYVCRQFNEEAAGLELKYNDLYIWKLDRHAGRNIGKMLFLVAGCVGKSKKHWLNGIVFHLKEKPRIVFQPKDLVAGHDAIFAFRTKYLLTKVHLTIPEWNLKLQRSSYGAANRVLSAVEFFLDGLSWEIVLHDLLPIPALTPIVLISRPKPVRSNDIIVPGVHQVSNFRIFPSDIEIEKDEGTILAACLWLGRLGHLRPQINDPDAFTHQCVELVKNWVKYGV